MSAPHWHTRPSVYELTHRLKDRARKITGPRKAILDILHGHPHPMTNKEIHQALAGDRCNLATVYRSMHLLMEMGLVKKFNFGDGIARFEMLHEDCDGHHHHLICTECATVVELQDCFSREWEEQLASRHGFSNVSHNLEFFGRCPRCQDSQ